MNARTTMAWRPRLLEAAESFPKPSGVRFSYGTAGFRTDAAILSAAVFRAGVLAALRSLITGKVTGLVITASHNQASDNGVKMVDPDGDMLVMSWESYADRIVNAANSFEILEIVDEILSNEDVTPVSWNGKVLVARDTRPSGEALVAAAVKGIEAIKASAADMGILTTPQLHWMVLVTNKGEAAPNEFAYYTTLSEAFRTLLQLHPSKHKPATDAIVVDGSNGVGASKLLDLQMLLEDLNFEVRNSGEGELNNQVGADFVQKERVPPNGFSASADAERRCVSIDGDADRLVYFYISADEVLHLLDGDKILSLFAVFLKQQLEALVGHLQPGKSYVLPGYGNLNFGVVQTAYANGASTKYLKETLGLDVILTPTGVKYLHQEAKKLDVAVYFEANGHGTIQFNVRFLEFLQKESNDTGLLDARCQAMKRLLAVSEMVNQAVGDAISGILMVELVLTYSGWTVQQWDEIYTDLPSRQLKVKVKDRSVITTTDAETKVARPLELRKAIDKEIEKYEQGRGFARPSGTEDVVRVYAEAASQALADELAAGIALVVHEYAGGVGPKPSST